jgi:hypothetical protein
LDKNITHGIGLDFSIEEEVFLLVLRMDCPFRPNTDYVTKLKDYYDCNVSASQISIWFKTRFENTGTYKVPSLVPIDKWMMQNATRVMAFHVIMDMFPDHSQWNFLDKEHIVNHNTLPRKLCADPLTGYVDAIPVSGNFHDAHNIFPIVSASPTQKNPWRTISQRKMVIPYSLLPLSRS